MNKEQQGKTTIINMKDILYNLIAQWKAVLIVAVFISFALTGLKYAKNIKMYADEMNKKKEIETLTEASEAELTSNVLESLSGDSRTTVEYMIQQKEWVETEKEYINKSILMNVDPTSQRTLLLDYYIYTEDLSNSRVASIVSGYTTYIYSEKVIEGLRKIVSPSLDTKYIAELISFPSYTSAGASSNDNDGDSLLEIRVVIPEAANAKDVEELFTSELTAYSSELSNSIGKHTITLVRSSEAKLYNSTAVSTRNSIIATIYNTQNYIKTMESSMTDEQKAAVNTIMSIKHSTPKSESNPKEEQLNKPGISKKVAVLGFMLGMLIYAFIYLVFVVIKGRITSASQIQYYTDVRALGECYYIGRYKGFRRLLHSKKAQSFIYRRKLDTTKQIQKIISSVEAACLHASNYVVSVLITHSPDAEYWDVVDSIISKMRERGIKANITKISAETEEKEIAAAKDAICIFSGDTNVAAITKLTSILAEYGVKQIGNIFIRRL